MTETPSVKQLSAMVVQPACRRRASAGTRMFNFMSQLVAAVVAAAASPPTSRSPPVLGVAAFFRFDWLVPYIVGVGISSTEAFAKPPKYINGFPPQRRFNVEVVPHDHHGGLPE